MGAVPVPREEVGRLIPRPCQPRLQPSGDCPRPEPNTDHSPGKTGQGKKGSMQGRHLVSTVPRLGAQGMG